MKIYFSPEYSGHVYIDWSAHHDMLWEDDRGGCLDRLQDLLGYDVAATRPHEPALRWSL